MPRPMALPDAIHKVSDQPIPFQGLINPRPLSDYLVLYQAMMRMIKMIKISQRYLLDNLIRHCIDNQRNCLMRFKMR